ncbi:MAG: hypothetical protein AAGF12_11855 [Myxococcota bacterium]
MRIIVLLMFIALGCSGEDPQIPEGMPMERLLTEVVEVQGWEEGEVLVFGQLLMPGQTVAPAFDRDGEVGEPFTVTEPTWFFWADLEPELIYFSHETSFIYMPESGGLVVEREEWFPVVDGRIYHPTEAIWGSFEYEMPSDTGITSNALRDRRGAPCGPAHAVLVQGFGWIDQSRPDRGGQFVDATIARLQEFLGERGYTIHRVTPLEAPDPEARVERLAEVLRMLREGQRSTQVDIFFVGHGNRFGRWVFGDHEEAPLSYSAEELIRDIGDANTDRLNVITEACRAGAFETTVRTTIDEYVQNSELNNSVVRFVASSLASQPSRAGLFIDRLRVALASQPSGHPFDYSEAQVPQIRIPLRGRGNEGQVYVQDPAPVREVAPTVPVLALDPDVDECQVVAHIDTQNYLRRTVIRGDGFGETPGEVRLFPWVDVAGAPVTSVNPVTVPIVSWSPNAIEVSLPMRSQGFPSNPRALEDWVADDIDWSDEGPEYLVGRYFTQVVNAAGQASRDYQFERNGTPHIHFYAPQLIAIAPQIYSEPWTPQYSPMMVEIEFNEMWIPLTPADIGLGSATVLVSDMRIARDPTLSFQRPPEWTVSGVLGLVGNRPHTTGSASLAFGDWTYGLPAAERNLATARDQTNPEINYWGFRQEMDRGWTRTDTWTYTLIYD